MRVSRYAKDDYDNPKGKNIKFISKTPKTLENSLVMY